MREWVKGRFTFSDKRDEDRGSDTVEDIEPLVPVLHVFIGVYHRHSQGQEESCWTLLSNKPALMQPR